MREYSLKEILLFTKRNINIKITKVNKIQENPKNNYINKRLNSIVKNL